MRRTAAVLALVALVAMGAAACVPQAVLLVTSTADAPDADPGDGVCEATAGAGDCTLRAAVDEANPVGGARIELPAGTYPLTSPLVVTGDVRINEEGTPHDPTIQADAAQAIQVAAGGALTLDGVTTFGTITVEGSALLRRSDVVGSGAPGLQVAASGVAVLAQSYVFIASAAPVRNEGTLHVWYSTIVGWAGGPVLDTQGAGQTSLLASLILFDGTFGGGTTACGGTQPVSLGHNGTPNGYLGFPEDSCGLSGPGDIGGVPPYYRGSWLGPGPSLDAIPVGAAGCGTDVTVDNRGNPRPADGNGDGTAACDMGHLERPAP